MFAAMRGHKDVVDILKENGASAEKLAIGFAGHERTVSELADGFGHEEIAIALGKSPSKSTDRRSSRMSVQSEKRRGSTASMQSSKSKSSKQSSKSKSSKQSS